MSIFADGRTMVINKSKVKKEKEHSIRKIN